MTEQLSFTMRALEAGLLSDLADQLTELVEQGSDADPARSRLTPQAYPDDRSASAEFQRLTAGDLHAQRVSDAACVRERVHEALLGEPDDDTEVVITLDEAQTESWIRTLSALRLVLSVRLGITADDSHQPGEEPYGLYDWLGYRLDLLIEAADARDGF